MLFVTMPAVLKLIIVILGVNMFYVWSVRGCTTYTLIILILSAAILIAFKMRVVILFVTTPTVIILIIVILGVNKLYILLEKKFYYLNTNYYHAESCNSDKYNNNDECNAVCFNASIPYTDYCYTGCHVSKKFYYFFLFSAFPTIRLEVSATSPP